MCASGFVEANVRDYATVCKKSGRAAPRTVEKLIGNQKIKRREIIAERTHRADGYHAFYAKQLQCANIGAIIDVARREAMSPPVPREERNSQPFERPDYDRVRRIAERRLHAH